MKRPGINIRRVGIGGKTCDHPKDQIIQTVFGKKYCKKCERNIK